MCLRVPIGAPTSQLYVVFGRRRAPFSRRLLWRPYAACVPHSPDAPESSYPPWRPWQPCAFGRRPQVSFAPRSVSPHSAVLISLASSAFSWLSRTCVWPLPSSFPLPAYLDCFRVSVVKSSAYRRRKQLAYKLYPTTRNRLAVKAIAVGSRSPQPYDVAQVNLQAQFAIALSIVEGQQKPVIRFRRTRKEWRM